MATQLFLDRAVPDTHLGTNNAKRDGTASGWWSYALATARGSGVIAASAPTVTGPTNGVESLDSGVNGPAQWISPPVAADVTISGTITANIWAAENSMSANVAINVIVDIIRANALGTANSNTIVNIVQSTNTVELGLTTRTANNFTSGMTSGGYTGQTLNRGDRLRVRVVGDDSAAATMAATFTFSVGWGGTTAAADGDSYVTFTEDFTFESASAVLDQNQGAAQGLVSSGSSTAQAQPFAAIGDGTLTEVRVWLSKTLAPTDNLTLTIESDSSGSPSGSVIGTVATVAGTSLTTTQTQYTYSCSIALTPSTTYWLVLRRGTPSATDYFLFGRLTGSSAAGWSGHKSWNTASWSAAAGTPTPTMTVRLQFQPAATTTVYLTDTASAVATASIDKEAWTSRGSGVTSIVTNTSTGWTAPVQATATAGGTVVDWFTRPLTAFTLTGMAVANIRALESNLAANASLRCEIARVEGDGTSPTVWASWCCAPTGADNGELTTSEVSRTINLSGDDLAITNGQRLRIRLYNEDSEDAAMVTGHTVTRYYAGTTGGASGDTYLTMPMTLTEYSAPASGGPAHRRRSGGRFLTIR